MSSLRKPDTYLASNTAVSGGSIWLIKISGRFGYKYSTFRYDLQHYVTSFLQGFTEAA
jgi:hypothetical protein